ncbi:multicopper oxidase domain-containing protein [Agromyces sp. H3Y2-19a]|uniref:multicopper oxidase family protein n=1 Tax=Agromyces chromiiresistens TaxID=3030835 RepID=UPI0023B93604|nr:multicopper oxidase domain-containing protein [Agromyces chromiiresistens]MDF0515154.1 multicopper oxidase domain-containing protein [Agromyces chromiiresistens]
MLQTRLRRPRAAIGSAIAAIAAGGLVAVAFAGCGLVTPAPVSTIGKVDFDRPLVIPPLVESTVDADGTRVFSLEAQAGATEFEPGEPSDTWGFNGSYLGPTLVADRGEHVRVEVTNSLDEPTTVHWHGMHLPPEMDGGPHQMVEPGASWSPEWDIDQQAATLWYHPHPHGETEDHVARGLAGMFILHDEHERSLGLPGEYGVDDIPVIVQDTGFSAEGEQESRQRTYAGGLGDELIVNGTRSPYLEVTDELVRLRLLNASTARTYAFTWSDARPVQLIATDGGLLETSVELDQVRLSPGERAEVLLRVTPGQRVVLQSRMTPEVAGLVGPVAATNGGSDAFDVLEVRAGDALEPAPAVPAQLNTIDDIDETEVATTRRFELSDSFEINGEAMDMGRIDETVTVDTLERWVVENATQVPHSFHVHDVQFRIASIGGEAPPPELSGWKDTIFTEPETEYELLMRFEDYTDTDTPYMYHCHLLWHEDQGMMGQFAVVEPGQSATLDPTGSATMTGGTHHEH